MQYQSFVEKVCLVFLIKKYEVTQDAIVNIVIVELLEIWIKTSITASIT